MKEISNYTSPDKVDAVPAEVIEMAMGHPFLFAKVNLNSGAFRFLALGLRKRLLTDMTPDQTAKIVNVQGLFSR